jgi:hypothetical protein
LPCLGQNSPAMAVTPRFFFSCLLCFAPIDNRLISG